MSDSNKRKSSGGNRIRLPIAASGVVMALVPVVVNKVVDVVDKVIDESKKNLFLSQ